MASGHVFRLWLVGAISIFDNDMDIRIQEETGDNNTVN